MSTTTPLSPGPSSPGPQTDARDDYGLARLRAAASPLYLREAEVQRGVALLLLGQAHLMREIDPLLREAGLGRAHFRMLSHIVRWPGLTMGDLIDLSGTSKQALSRVAKDLIGRDLAVMTPGLADRRRRELRATGAGAALQQRLDAVLAGNMGGAYAGAGKDAVTGFWQVLEGLVPVAIRAQIATLEKSAR